jgi:hypothetical protein
MRADSRAAIAAIALAVTLLALPAFPQAVPRTAGGKPNLEGIWQATSTAAADLEDHAARFNMPAGLSVVTGGAIPYQPWAAAKKAQNSQNRQKADPLNQCFIPGVPRIMYLDFPFQIFQTPQAIGMAFEWSLDYRLIYTDGSSHPKDIDSWMGDSRGRWEGDTLVVDVSNMNDKTWLDMAGDFHSDALHVVERYRMSGRDTIEYEARSMTPRCLQSRGRFGWRSTGGRTGTGFSNTSARPKPRRPTDCLRAKNGRGIRATARLLPRGAALRWPARRMGRRRTFAGNRTANPICRASTNPMPAAPTTGSANARQRPTTSRPPDAA